MRAFGGNGADGLRASGEEVWYRSLVEKVPAVLYVDASDESSSALFINPRGESLLGYSREQWLEDPGMWVKTLHPEDKERVLAEHERARRTGDTFEVEYRLVARNGSVLWVRDEAAPVESEEGGPGRRAGMHSTSPTASSTRRSSGGARSASDWCPGSPGKRSGTTT